MTSHLEEAPKRSADAAIDALFPSTDAMWVELRALRERVNELGKARDELEWQRNLARDERDAARERVKRQRELLEMARRELFYSMTQDRSEDTIWKTIAQIDAAFGTTSNESAGGRRGRGGVSRWPRCWGCSA